MLSFQVNCILIVNCTSVFYICQIMLPHYVNLITFYKYTCLLTPVQNIVIKYILIKKKKRKCYFNY